MYTLNIKKMKIELKNIYTSERFSEETTCFKSDLFCDGKKVGYCKNDGQGGNTHYEGIGYHYEKIKDMEEYCKTLPPIVYTKEEHGSDFTINMTLEHYIDDLLMKFLDKKEEVKLKKTFKKGIVFGKSKYSYSVITWKGHTVESMLTNPFGLETIRKKVKELTDDGHKILNTNLPF